MRKDRFLAVPALLLMIGVVTVVVARSCAAPGPGQPRVNQLILTAAVTSPQPPVGALPAAPLPARTAGRASAAAWTSFPTPSMAAASPLYAVATAAHDDAWAVGEGGGVYHFDGSAWSAIHSGVAFALHSVAPVPGEPGHAVVGGVNEGGETPSLVLSCTLAGCTRDMTVPALGRLDSVWALSGTDFWVAGGNSNPQTGVILHFSNGAWSANQVTGSVPNVHYHNLQMLGAAEGYAVGEAETPDGPGVLVHYDGAAWQAVNTGLSYTGPLQGLWFTSAGEGWVVGGVLGLDPLILHYVRGASPEWRREAVSNLRVPTLLWYVNMASDGSGYASGNNGLILYRPAGASDWQPVYRDASSAPLYGVWVAPDGSEGWAVGGPAPGQPVFGRLAAAVLLMPRIYLPLLGR